MTSSATFNTTNQSRHELRALTKQRLTYWREPHMFLFQLFVSDFGTTFYTLSVACVKKINSHVDLIYNSMGLIGVIYLMTVIEVTCMPWSTMPCTMSYSLMLRETFFFIFIFYLYKSR